MKRFIVTANTKDEAIEKVKKHLAKDEPSRAEEIDELKKKFENKDKLLEEKFDALEKECQSLLDAIVDKMTEYYEKYHADLDALKELNESYEVTKNGFKFNFYPQYGEMIIDIHDMAGIIPDEMINNIDAELFEEDEDPKADIGKSIKRLKELKERLSLLDSAELMEDAFNSMSNYVVKLLEARNQSVGLDAKAKDDKFDENCEENEQNVVKDSVKDAKKPSDYKALAKQLQAKFHTRFIADPKNECIEAPYVWGNRNLDKSITDYLKSLGYKIMFDGIDDAGCYNFEDSLIEDDKPAEKRIVIEMSDEHIIEDVEKDNPKVDFFLKHIIDGYETWLLSSFEVTALEKAIEDIKKALK